YAFAELDGGLGPLARLCAEFLQLFALCLKLSYDGLEGLQDKLAFVSRLKTPGLNWSSLRFAHELAIGTKEPAEQK
ncbi:MAG: hypothetical protein ABR568_24240, partial [Pyrinomonadaceae bacterium]